MRFREFINELLIFRRCTKKDLARDCGVPLPQLSRYYNGQIRPNIVTLQKFIDFANKETNQNFTYHDIEGAG